MKRWVLALLLCIFTSGCVSLQIIPKESVVHSLRAISVVPVEGMPLIFNHSTPGDVKAIKALLQSTRRQERARAPTVNGSRASFSRSDAPLAAASPARTLGAGAIFEIPVAALAGSKVPGETAVIEMGEPSQTWMPNVEFAQIAIDALQQGGKREVRMIDGYIKPPITDRSMTWHMENWNGPINRWYNSDVSTVDYAAIGSNHADAILEVGVFSYQYYREALMLHVFVKLIDPRTKQVLGRAKSISFPPQKAGPLAPLLQNGAEGMKRLILETGDRLVAKCLTKIGLISE